MSEFWNWVLHLPWKDITIIMLVVNTILIEMNMSILRNRIKKLERRG